MSGGVILVRDVTRASSMQPDENGDLVEVFAGPVPVHGPEWVSYHDGQAFAVLRRVSDGTLIFAHVLADGAEMDPPDPSRALFFAVSPHEAGKAILRQLALSSHLAWTPAELRADNGVAATKIKALIKDTRPLDDQGQPIGFRAALRITVGGYDLIRDSETAVSLTDL